MKRVRLYLLLAAIALLTACAGQRTQPTQKGESALDHWQIRAKVGFRSPNKAQSANMVWKKTPEEDDILLFGPFGAGKVRILENKTETVLIDGDKRYRAENSETLLKELTGLTFPLTYLDSWIQGSGSPEASISNILADELGRATQFEQAGWTVSYLRYASEDAQALPTKIKLNSDDFSVTIVIQSWDE